MTSCSCMRGVFPISALVRLVFLLSTQVAGTQVAGNLGPECSKYLQTKGIWNPDALKAALTQCAVDRGDQGPRERYSPDPVPKVPGATDTSELACRYGHPSYYGGSGTTCCGWRPHFNWVVATCDSNHHQQTSMFCRNMPPCIGPNGCGAKINYVAAYQYNGKEFVLLDESSTGQISNSGIEGSFSHGTGWEKEKHRFMWKSGDWTTKYAPWGDGKNGPRGSTPPAMMWVLSAESFYYGAFYMLSQLTLNLEGHGNPSGTNCWNWELDPVEGSAGWVPPGSPLPGNVNQLYSTNNAAVSGCMPVTYFASQANGLKKSFSQPAMFQEFCQKNPSAIGCQPWEQDVMWSGGALGSQRFENYADQAYVFAVVVDHNGYWIYRWIPDKSTGETGWPGIGRHSSARTLGNRPRAVTDPRGLATDVRGDVPEAVILQPSVTSEAACLRASIEAVNFQFGADALGAIATEIGGYERGGKYEGAQNWWTHFADTSQYQGYPLSIAGVPYAALTAALNCNVPGSMRCNCQIEDFARRLKGNESDFIMM